MRTKYIRSPWSSFSTIQRKENDHSLSHLMKSLNPAIPVLPIGIFRCFRAVACICIGASPNEDNIIVIFEWYSRKYKLSIVKRAELFHSYLEAANQITQILSYVA